MCLCVSPDFPEWFLSSPVFLLGEKPQCPDSPPENKGVCLWCMCWLFPFSFGIVPATDLYCAVGQVGSQRNHDSLIYDHRDLKRVLRFHLVCMYACDRGECIRLAPCMSPRITKASTCSWTLSFILVLTMVTKQWWFYDNKIEWINEIE